MSVVQTEFADGVLTVTMADEEKRNALSRRLVRDLYAALDDAEADPEVRVIVLTNTGRAFCAGADLSERSSDASGEDRGSPFDPMKLFGRFKHASKPYVGRIAGHCVGGGMGLAAALDISIASEDAKFGFTEVRLGVAPAMISVVCLPKLREADAKEAFLRGHRFPAAEAARIGLITRAVPADQLDAAVTEVVDDLLAGGPGALTAAKQLLLRVPTMSEEEAFEWTAGVSNQLFRSDEAREGMAAFLEKRAPDWSRGS